MRVVKNSDKQVIILRHSGGRLGNQLLLYASIYAFCLEYGFQCINYTFYNYRDYFNLPKGDKFTQLFGILGKLKFYNTHAAYVLVYKIYELFTFIYTFFRKGISVKEDPKNIIYLPPTRDKIRKHQKLIEKITLGKGKLFYFDGWHFQNPGGLKKYRKEIIGLLKPKKHILTKVKYFIEPFKHYHLIGVHIRQGEYKSKRFMGGSWYFSEKEVAKILDSYLKTNHKEADKVKFIICSDGPLDLSYFSGLNTTPGIGSMMEDLITLSMCNVILGSNSTFGSFAAYYGNIPFLIFDHEKKWIKADGENLFQNSNFS